MKTFYKCEGCGFSDENMSAVAACECKCRLAMELDSIFGSDQWNPPLPLIHFKKWSTGDRAEMARRLEDFFEKYFISEGKMSIYRNK